MTRMSHEDVENDAIDSMFCTLRVVRASGVADWNVLTSFLANLCLGTPRPFELNQRIQDEVARKMRVMNQ